MDPIPIDASPDAADWITERVMEGALDPDLEGRVPVLSLVLHHRRWDHDQRLIEEIQEEHCMVRWYRPGWVAGMFCQEVVVSGLRLFIVPETVRRLAGKRLVLRPLEFGFTPEGKPLLMKAVDPTDDDHEPG